MLVLGPFHLARTPGVFVPGPGQHRHGRSLKATRDLSAGVAIGIHRRPISTPTAYRVPVVPRGRPSVSGFSDNTQPLPRLTLSRPANTQTLPALLAPSTCGNAECLRRAHSLPPPGPQPGKDFPRDENHRSKSRDASVNPGYKRTTPSRSAIRRSDRRNAGGRRGITLP